MHSQLIYDLADPAHIAGAMVYIALLGFMLCPAIIALRKTWRGEFVASTGIASYYWNRYPRAGAIFAVTVLAALLIVTGGPSLRNFCEIHFETYATTAGEVLEFSYDQSGTRKAPREIDRLTVNSMTFIVRCSPPERPADRPFPAGLCLDLKPGDRVKVAYTPGHPAPERLEPLRVWRLE